MKKAHEVLPFYKNDVSVSKKVQFGELEKFPNGKQAQDFLLRCEDGIPASEFDDLAKSPDMTKILNTLHEQLPERDRDQILAVLRFLSNTNYLLSKLDGSIPWEIYLKRYPCLALPTMTDEQCIANEACSVCKTILRRRYVYLIEMLLTRHDILSEDGGIFADRLLTALELGVPFERIRKSMGSTFDVAVAILKKHFPDCSEEWLAKCSEEYIESWESPESSSGKSPSDFEDAAAKKLSDDEQCEGV